MLIQQTQRYLKRFAFSPATIEEPPAPTTGMFIVIPCYNEPNLLATLDALWLCERPQVGIEILVVLNASARASEAVHQQNEQTRRDIEHWSQEHPCVDFHVRVIWQPDLPVKHAGVGLARKIGLDEAVARLPLTQQQDAILVNLDADCLCDSTYLIELERFFREYPEAAGCYVYFEHPLEGSLETDIYAAITQYELYLRYYVLAVRSTGHPAAYHTVGSTIALRAETYRNIGGMNKRRAAEDFYFLQKLALYGPFLQLNTTRVIPDSRISDRNPFGTGPAVGAMLQKEHTSSSQQPTYPAYDPRTFQELQFLLRDIELLYDASAQEEQRFLQRQSECAQHFLKQQRWIDKLAEFRKNTTTPKSFVKRFYTWFNAFMVLRWVHYFREHRYPDIAIEDAARWALQNVAYPQANTMQDATTLLHAARQLERSFHGAFRLDT